jgi:hypothetical protein
MGDSGSLSNEADLNRNPDTHRVRRSFGLWLLILSLLLVSFYGWMRLQYSVVQWDILIWADVYPGPLYMAISGGVWGILGTVSGLGLFFRQRWAVNLTRASVLVMAGWYWIDRLFLVQSPAARANLTFAIFVTIASLVYTFGVLAAYRQRQYFGIGK